MALLVVSGGVLAYTGLYYLGWSQQTTVIALFAITAVFGLGTGASTTSLDGLHLPGRRR